MFRKSWGDRPLLGRLSRFVGLLLLFWLPLAIPIYSLIEDSNTASILGTGILYVQFLVLLRLWGKRVYGESRVFSYYGLDWTAQNGWEFLGGLLGAIAAILVLFLVQVGLGWLHWQGPQVPLASLVGEAVVVGVAVGFAEELLFRGWFWDELRRDYSQSRAIALNGVVFALLHFIKPLPEILRTAPQFFGLLLLGVVLAQLKLRGRGRLGYPIGFHGGLVAAYYGVNVGELWRPAQDIPSWITGIDGNPLAGLLGLLLLVAIVSTPG
ncbi:MAG: CPBP family intramembrane metalloprotease [Phormidium sp. GEM2.Bin31]|nr:MAG: CPBP family intramembrane metalloprotease [Phormidium sp. GEM2.Bin31]